MPTTLSEKPLSTTTRSRKVPIRDIQARRKAREKEERISAVMTVILLMALLALMIWAVVTGDPSEAEMMWDYYHV